LAENLARQSRNPIILVIEDLRIEDEDVNEDEDEKSSQNATILRDCTAKTPLRTELESHFCFVTTKM
jgi:hypothetical protein